MRTRINLATQPYEDAKQFLVRFGTVVLLLAIATAGLVWFTFHSVRQSSDVNRQISDARNNLDRLNREKLNAERMLALPQNKGTVDKSEYLNAILARKAFSWTTVFSDMEKIMPPGLRVLSITPTLDDQNQLVVHIMVGGESRERALQLVQNLEKTPRFRDVQLRSDTMADRQVNGRSSETTGTSDDRSDPIHFDIVSRYLPTLPGANTNSAAAKDSENAEVAQEGSKP